MTDPTPTTRPDRGDIMVNVLSGIAYRVFENWNHAPIPYAEYKFFECDTSHRIMRLRQMRGAMPAERRQFQADWFRHTGKRILG